MIEALQYITSGFWVWMGTCSLIAVSGLAGHAILMGFRGKKID